ncbi:alpha/beta fold hydrolase [Kribbella sp. VKM Ac-2569]|uniref:alpha/beta fold hydrolase n=1 Tax=Kribbella sp. VKM Ac-2569 TaxID=2512220 RepID=UPI00102B1645|nr:alpha/beta fold hydrolase [Kribbella sp. VKM Ac-2569]
MRQHPARIIGCVTAALTLLSWVPSAGATATNSEDPTNQPRLAWQDCGDGFECATARVPLDYDKPDGRSIELALLRLPATDPAGRIGSLFVNPGGPGNSAVQYVQESARSAYPAGVRARFDIVGMDPRGVGASTPVQCFDTAADQAQFFAGYNPLPINRPELNAAANLAAELARRCQARSGWLLPHLSTANVARDLDAMRKAVGDAKLSYVGYSYGTYLGATYANLFPGKVRALALDGNTDPTAYPAGSPKSVPFVRVNAHLAASETLDQFFTLCAAAGPRCDFATGGHPRTKFATLAARLRENPLVLPDGLVFGYALLVDFTLASLYRAADWAFAASILQQVYAATSPGSIARVPSGPAATHDPPASNTRESLFASVCSDTRNPAEPSDYAHAAAAADRQARTSARSGPTSPCRARPGRPRIPTATPALGGSVRRTLP